jgi:DNA-binding GntR family transcriptional regulator
MKADLSRQVLEQIRNQILTFKLLPGVKISDKEVAEQLGISRTPVREALIHLVEQGLLDSRPNRGFTVKVFTIKEVEDLYTLRSTLEEMAVRLTTRGMDDGKAMEMQAILDTYPKLLESRDLAGYNNADESFHDLIAVSSGNRLLVQHLRSLHGQIRIVRRYDHLRTESFQETRNEHQEILDLMIRRDADGACLAMSRHILRSMGVIMEIIQQTQND